MKYIKAMRNFLLVGVLFIGAIGNAGCGNRNEEGRFSGDEALQLASTQLDFGSRVPGTLGHLETGDWIAAELEAEGWISTIQEFEYRGVQLRNIIGKSNVQAAPGPVVIGAHYDTRPQADRDLSHPLQPVPGANDGASGVAVLLELASVLDEDEFRQPIWLVFFDGEDSGKIDGWDWIVGSTYFVEHLTSTPEAVVIVDMVGDEDLQLYYERNSDDDLAQEIWEIAADLGYPSFIAEERYSIIDDHIPFIHAGIPAVDIIDFDYPFWHTAHDTIDKISASSLEQVGRTLQLWLERTAEKQ
jgi:glutaminyl-peptide cyclotransferase